MDNPSIKQQLLASALEASQQDSLQVFQTEKVRGSLIACVPFFKDEQTTAIFCGIFHDDKAKCREALLVCQCIANHFELWRSRDQLTSMATEVRNTARVLELVGKTEGSPSIKDACVRIANELQALFRCDYVAVGLKKSSFAACRLVAVSAMSEFDHRSRTTTLMQNAFDEAILRGVYTSFPAPPEKQTSPALAQRKLAQSLNCEASISIPIRNENDDLLGAITVLGNRLLDRNESTRNLIKALEHPIGNCLGVVRYAEGGWLTRLQRMIFSSEKINTKWAVMALVLMSVGAMFVPVSYRVNSNCTAEPVIRSFCVAPDEGLLESTLVEPGEVVKKGQVLARMDGRDIGFQIANVLAEKNRAAKEHDAYLANGEISESLRADLERMALDAELNLLKHKQQNLQIESGTDGVVLSGSLDKRENYPVTLGQTLYEIGPLSPLRVELAIPAEEVMHVTTGQMVKFRFDGFGTATITGTVDKLRPSSTIRDDENVFIAEVILPNEDGQVRPGMKGFARVYGREHSLGWTLFHRPWEKIMTAIGF